MKILYQTKGNVFNLFSSGTAVAEVVDETDKGCFIDTAFGVEFIEEAKIIKRIGKVKGE